MSRWLLGCGLLSMLLPGVAPGQLPPSHPAVFAVMKHPSQGTKIWGTAFAIDLKNGVILSAAHVVSAALANDPTEPIELRYYFNETSFVTLHATLVAAGIDVVADRTEHKDTTDWAVLLIVPDDMAKLADLDLGEISPAPELTAARGGRYLASEVHTVGYLRKAPPPRRRDGRVTQGEANSTVGLFRASVFVTPGNSGGPIVCDRGAIGIATGRALVRMANGQPDEELEGEADCIGLDVIIYDICRKLPAPPGLGPLQESFAQGSRRALTDLELRALHRRIKQLTALERYKLLQIARDHCPSLIKFLFVHAEGELPATVEIMRELVADPSVLTRCAADELARTLRGRREAKQALSVGELEIVNFLGERILLAHLAEGARGGISDGVLAEMAALPGEALGGRTRNLLDASLALVRVHELSAQVAQADADRRQLQDQLAYLTAAHRLEVERTVQLAVTASKSSPVAAAAKTKDPYAFVFDTSVKAASSDSVPAEYVVRPGDTLTKISRKFFGTANRWKEILAANPEVGNASPLKVGTKLRLPQHR